MKLLFSVFKISTGLRVREGQCQAVDLAAQADGEDEKVFEGLHPHMYLVKGELVEYTEDQKVTRSVRPPFTKWDNAQMNWVNVAAEKTLDQLEVFAHTQIDAASGAARLRYITDVPGQQAVYLRKAEQAQAYVSANFKGDAPPYIAAEAAATSLTAQQAAERILYIANVWDNQLSPAIEQARISGKAAVTAAKEAGDRVAMIAAQAGSIVTLEKI